MLFSATGDARNIFQNVLAKNIYKEFQLRNTFTANSHNHEKFHNLHKR